jgi:isopentenyl phosphate kinase
VARIKASLLRLHSAFLEELVKAGMNAVSCPGCDFFKLRRARPVLRDKRLLSAWLDRGFVPVVNSDLFPAADGGFRVVSSDGLTAELAEAFRPRLTVFFTDTGGVLDAGGKVIRELDAAGLARLVKGRARSANDVSGGMAGKAAELLRMSSRGLASLVLDGRRPGKFAEPWGSFVEGTFIRPRAR